MVFSSIPFLYYFLPAVLIVYFATPKKLANSVLLLASLIFYGYGEPRFLLLMSISILCAYGLGLLIPKYKWSYYLSVIISLGMLGFFKYADFFIESFAAVTGMPVKLLGIGLPIGISFYTFQILSYTIDLNRGKLKPQKNLINFAAYVALFPQLIAGPIVVYSAVEEQLIERPRNIDGITSGIRRFAVGLGKKVFIANALGELCSTFAVTEEKTVLFYWIYAVAFTLQIYFDFSGYSDMAIGLGKIFGFSFPENFNYPYISTSITEFWRRWHMTLGSWFREYVYIPLGGNRVPEGRWLWNIIIVWALTGLWHGAAWNFVVWGLFYGALLISEKYFINRLMEKAPGWVRRVYVLLIVIISMVIFNASSLGEAGIYISSMFGGNGLAFANDITLYYLRSFAVIFVAAVIGSTPIIKMAGEKLCAKSSKLADAGEIIMVLGILALVTAYLVDGSFNPFLYFRF